MTPRSTFTALVLAALVAAGTSALAAPTPAPSEPAGSDLDGDGAADVLATDLRGALWLYPGDGSGGWRPARQVGRGWSLMDDVQPVGDWDGDGRTDVVARSIPSGDLLLYPGDGAGALQPPRRIGRGWQVYADVVAPGDWTGDGHVDVLGVRRDDGRLVLHAGDGGGGWQPARVVGSAWHGLDLVTPVGDWDGDGDADLVARARGGGDLWLYPGDGAGGFTRPRVVGTGFGGATALLGPGDFDGDGAADLMARDGAGRLRLYRGNGSGGFAPRPYPLVGTGWQRLLLDERTQLPRRVVRYSVRSLGRVAADVGAFGRHVDETLNDPRGWSLGRDVRFDQVPSGGELTVYLAAPDRVAAAAGTCSAAWSCRVGDGVYINDLRWRAATDTYAAHSPADYRHYVVNHEVGHWLGLGHLSCGGAGQPAPVMQQQSKALAGCTTNVWPLPPELRRVRDLAL